MKDIHQSPCSRLSKSPHGSWNLRLPTLAAIGLLGIAGCSDKAPTPQSDYRHKTSGITLPKLEEADALALKPIHSDLSFIAGSLESILEGTKEQGQLWVSTHAQQLDQTAEAIHRLDEHLNASFTHTRFNKAALNARVAMLLSYNRVALATFENECARAQYWASSDHITGGGLDGFQIVERTAIFLREINSEISSHVAIIAKREAEERRLAEARRTQSKEDNSNAVPWNLNPANPNGIYGGMSTPTFQSSGSGK